MSFVFKTAKTAKYPYRVHLSLPGAMRPQCGTPGRVKDWRFTAGPVTCRRCWEKMGWDGKTPELPFEQK